MYGGVLPCAGAEEGRVEVRDEVEGAESFGRGCGVLLISEEKISRLSGSPVRLQLLLELYLPVGGALLTE